nr:MAG TPA: hypothetical protein [Caudoviricetes sp.]
MPDIFFAINNTFLICYFVYYLYITVKISDYFLRFFHFPKP